MDKLSAIPAVNRAKFSTLWVLCCALAWLCTAGAIVSILSLDLLYTEIQWDPEVRYEHDYLAYDTNWTGKWTNYKAAQQRAEEKIEPSLALWNGIAIGGSIAAFLFFLLESALSVRALGERGLDANHRCFVASIALFLIGAVGLTAGVIGSAAWAPYRVHYSAEVEGAERITPRELWGEPHFALRDAEDRAWQRIKPPHIASMALTLFAATLHIRATVAYVVSFCVLLFKLWKTVQDGRAQTTPVRAVVICFIPLFNLFWFFAVLPGLADELNRHLEERGSEPIGKGIFYLYAFLLAVATIPFLGLVAALVGAFVGIVAFRSAIRAAREIGRETGNIIQRPVE